MSDKEGLPIRPIIICTFDHNRKASLSSMFTQSTTPPHSSSSANLSIMFISSGGTRLCEDFIGKQETADEHENNKQLVQWQNDVDDGCHHIEQKTTWIILAVMVTNRRCDG